MLKDSVGNLIPQKYHALTKGISWMFASSIITNISTFLLLIVLAHFYSHEEFGLWASITSIAAVIITGDFGVTNVLRNILSKERLRGEEGDIVSRQYFFSAMIFFLLMAAACSIALYLMRNNIPYEALFKTDNNLLKSEGKEIFLVVQFVFLLGIPLGLGSGMFFSYGESRYSAIFNIIRALLSFGVVVALSLFHVSISLVSQSYFIVNLVVTTASTLFFIHRRRWYRVSLGIRDFLIKTKEMLLLGVKFLVTQLSSSFLSNVLVIYCGSMVGLSTSANVSMVQKLYLFFVGIYQSAFNPLWGELADAYYKGKYSWCSTLLKKSLTITVAFFAVAIVVTMAFGDWFVNTVMGSAFTASYSIIFLVGLLFTAKTLFDNASLLQNATNKMNIVFVGYILMSIYAAYVLPYVLNSWGLNLMIINMLLLWGVFIGIILIHAKSLLKYIKNEN